MVTETRYFRNARSTVNGLYCFELGTTNTALMRLAVFAGLVGIRVWKRASDGTETEITAGTPVAQVTLEGSNTYKTNTWGCPETALAATDSIVVRVYFFMSGAWTLYTFEDGAQTVFQTEQLNTTILNAGTWTVYYYDYSDDFYGWRFGDSVGQSRVEGFKYGEVAAVAVQPLGDGLVFVVG